MSVNANVTVPLGSGGLVRIGVGSGVALTWTVFAVGGVATASSESPSDALSAEQQGQDLRSEQCGHDAGDPDRRACDRSRDFRFRRGLRRSDSM